MAANQATVPGIAPDPGYLDAVARGDMAAAQAIIDRAARAAGFTLETWRGESSGGDHTDFSGRVEPGIFTSQNRDFAGQYAARGGTGEPRRFYVRAGRVLDLESPGLAEHRWMSEWGKAYGEKWIDRQSGEPIDVCLLIAGGGLFDYEGDWSARAWRDLQRSARADGYDVLIARDSGYGEDCISTIVLRDTHIRLADAVVCDDAGDPVPPSARFAPGATDIRGRVPDPPFPGLRGAFGRAAALAAAGLALAPG